MRWGTKHYAELEESRLMDVAARGHSRVVTARDRLTGIELLGRVLGGPKRSEVLTVDLRLRYADGRADVVTLDVAGLHLSARTLEDNLAALDRHLRR